MISLTNVLCYQFQLASQSYRGLIDNFHEYFPKYNPVNYTLYIHTYVYHHTPMLSILHQVTSALLRVIVTL